MCFQDMWGDAAEAETSFSHHKVTFRLWVQGLTWDQELLGKLGTPPCDTQASSENTTVRRGTAFPSLHSLKAVRISKEASSSNILPLYRFASSLPSTSVYRKLRVALNSHP